MTDEELNALVEALRDVADHAGYVPHLHHTAATAITTLRAQLAEAQRLMRLERTIADKNADRADRAEQRVATLEAALAAQIEADAGVDPEKFLELVIYAAKEASEKALRDAVRSLRRRKAVYLLKARKAMRSAGEVQDPYLQSQQWEKSDQMMHTAEAHDYAIADILALIEKEKPNLYGEAE